MPPRDMQAMSDVVLLAIKAAHGPLLERIAALEQQHRSLVERVQDVSGIRDRVVMMETKAAQPADVPAVLDVAPLLERLAAAEARLSVLGDLRDRVVTIETKAAQPVAVLDTSDLRDRLTALETVPAVDLSPLAKIDGLTEHLSALRERVGVMEVRAQIPGPSGKDGADGKDGRDGTHGHDGADGLGWDDLAVVQEDERTAVVKGTRGLQVKEFGRMTFPVEIYRDVYLDGKTYERGDCVTWAGSEWHCNKQTATKPGDGSKAWTLKVKRGRDGKDGRDAMSIPVVSVTR